MNTAIKILVSITIIFIFLSGYTHFTSQSSIKSIQGNVTQLTNAEGNKYLEYCDGGLSDQIVANDNNYCIADYPGVFGAQALIYLTILMLIITGIVFGIKLINK